MFNKLTWTLSLSTINQFLLHSAYQDQKTLRSFVPPQPPFTPENSIVMSKPLVPGPTTDPFFCTQLLFVPPERHPPPKPEDISQNPELALKQNLLWKAGTVLRVRFLDGGQHDKVMKYARKWTEHANISFEVVSTEDAEIRVALSQQTDFSYVGTASRELSQEKATMSLRISSTSAEENIARAVLHGFGHALGLKHVHQVSPPDIPWDYEKLYSYYKKNLNWSEGKVDLNVLDILKADAGPLSSRDGESVMLYSISEDLTSNEVSIQGQGALTAADIALVSKSYPPWNDLNASLVPTIHPIDPWQNIAIGGTYTLHQAISPAASAVPQAAIGLTNIAVSVPDEWIRITSKIASVTTSNIDVQVGTWSPTFLALGTSSLFWATPQFPNPTFQTGRFHTEKTAINQRIQFNIPYKTKPKVFIGLSGIDMGGTFDLDTKVTWADKDGFNVDIKSSGNLKAANIDWVAWPGNHPGVETGTFSAGPVANGVLTKGETKFDTVFDSQPKVHFALSNFNVANKHDNFALVLDAKVTKTTLIWSAGTWLRQGLNWVGANYLVFKV